LKRLLVEVLQNEQIGDDNPLMRAVVCICKVMETPNKNGHSPFLYKKIVLLAAKNNH
jgi:hypothetical protein